MQYNLSELVLHNVDFVFHCALGEGSEPRLPDNPDTNEVAVHWIPLDEFPDAPLIPQIQHRVIASLQRDSDDPFCLSPDITDEIKSLKRSV